MRRILLLVGLPVVLLAVWKINSTESPTNATVDIDTNKVVELRGAVISRLASVGGVKVGENTSFDDGNSNLVFKIPTARLEEALAELDVVGGQVTNQRIDVGSADSEAESVGEQLRGVQGCFRGLGGTLANLDTGERNRLADCRQRLDKVSSSFDAAPTDLSSTDLRVNLHAHDPITWWLTLAVATFVVALIVMGFTTWRSIRRDRVIDLSDDVEVEARDELYLRRN